MAIAPPLPATKSDISANDAVVDLFMERAIDLIRLETGTRDKVWSLLDQLQKDIVKTINNIDIRGVDASGHQRNRLAKLLKIVRASIQATYRGANTLMAQEIREIADIEGTWTVNAINASVHAEFADSGVTRQFLTTLASDVLIQGAPTKEWWGRQAAGLADRFADEMRRGVALGESNSQLVDRVRGTKTQSGLMDVSRTSAERLVRASVQTVANAAREATYDANTDLIAALQWHATLDTRTSIYCITRDGHKYEPQDEHAAMDGGPPWLDGPGALHWGCRSTSVPVLKSWRDLGIDADEIPKTTRSSMDGQVAHDLTFEDWLKKQSIARQDDVLGKGKADLWRAGKIKFRDLLDQNGRPLTTEELRAKTARKSAT